MSNPWLSTLMQSRGLSIVSGILLAALWGLFSFSHLTKFRETGELAMLLIVIAETMAAAFYIVRSDPKSVSLIPLDWFVAIAGTFVPMLFRPTDFGILPAASHAIIIGLALQILALASLNRSFAIVAAQRNIKTGKMYRIVRHPIYASYCIIFTSYALANTNLSNLLVYLALITLIVLRIFQEERHLSSDLAYREYMHRVHYRLIPLIF